MIRPMTPADRPAVLALIEATGFFRPDEIAVAEELIDITLDRPGPEGLRNRRRRRTSRGRGRRLHDLRPDAADPGDVRPLLDGRRPEDPGPRDTAGPWSSGSRITSAGPAAA